MIYSRRPHFDHRRTVVTRIAQTDVSMALVNAANNMVPWKTYSSEEAMHHRLVRQYDTNVCILSYASCKVKKNV